MVNSAFFELSPTLLQPECWISILFFGVVMRNVQMIETTILPLPFANYHSRLIHKITYQRRKTYGRCDVYSYAWQIIIVKENTQMIWLHLQEGTTISDSAIKLPICKGKLMAEKFFPRMTNKYNSYEKRANDFYSNAFSFTFAHQNCLLSRADAFSKNTTWMTP